MTYDVTAGSIPSLTRGSRYDRSQEARALNPSGSEGSSLAKHAFTAPPLQIILLQEFTSGAPVMCVLEIAKKETALFFKKPTL